MTPHALLGRRARAMRALLLLVFGALVFRLVAVQVLSHSHYQALSNAQLTTTVTVPALRGGIYDRNGEILAESVPKKTVVADPYLIKHPASVAATLAPILRVPASQLRSELTERSGFVYLAHRVDAATASAVAGKALPGINLVDDTQRVLPDGKLAEPVLGMVGTDGTGLSGLEYQYQSLLSGTPGTDTVLQAPDGVTLSGTGASAHGAKPGTGLELTLDQTVQFVAERALAAEVQAAHAEGGTAILMDVKTGGILAMANLVSTQPASAGSGAQGGSTTSQSVPSGGQSVSSAGAGSPPVLVSNVTTLPKGVTEAPSDTALTDVYEPGSVFKLVTFSAALANGVVNPQSTLTVPNALPMGTYVFHDAESHPTETLTATQILARSSNIGTIEIASALGKDRLLNQISNLGFGKPTGLGFPGESRGLIPPADAWTQTSIGSTPIGQDDAVTAQQILDAYNAVANGGVFVQPRLVRATVAPDGTVKALPSSPRHRVIDPATDKELVTMFEQVVKSGTGTQAVVDGYTIAGKTGTASIPSPSHLGYIPGAYMATFCGFAPAEDPVFSAIVVLKHPTPAYGGSVAAPVFAKIMQYALHHYGIPTTAAATPSTSSGAVGGAGSIKVTAGVTTEGP